MSRCVSEDYFGLQRDVGQMTVLAVGAENPPGCPVTDCKRVPINLTVDSPDDLEVFREGVAALRRRKIQRLTWEAQEQGALLTQEDLARSHLPLRWYMPWQAAAGAS